MRLRFKAPGREEILTGPALRTMARIGIPAVLSSVLFTFYNLADAAWIGRLPERAEAVMAGIQVSWPFVWLIISFVTGFGGAAVTALVAQYIGAGRPEEANFALNQLLTVAVISGFVLGAAGFLLTPWIVSLLVHDVAVSFQSSVYLEVIFLGLPTMMVPGMFFYAYSSTGDTVTPLLVNLVGTGLNVIIDPFLILGWGPFPQMGILGAAYATIASQGVATIIFLYLFWRGKDNLRLDARALVPRWRWMSRAIRIGFPAAIGQSTVALGFVVLMGLIGRLDNAGAALAGYGIADRIFGILFIVTNGLGVGLTTMIGQALGANVMGRARELMRKGVAALFVILILEAAVLWLARSSLVALFIPGSEDAIREGARFIELFAAGMPLLGAFFAAEAIYRGAGHNVPTMILGLLRLWGLRLPLSWAFAFRLGMQSDGIWLGMSLSNVVSGLAAIGFLVSGSWQRSVVEPAEPDPPDSS
jgi:putative MATE family efflux protein